MDWTNNCGMYLFNDKYTTLKYASQFLQIVIFHSFRRTVETYTGLGVNMFSCHQEIFHGIRTSHYY